MGASILNVDLYNCTGDTLGNISGCTGSTMVNYTVMPGYTNIPKRNFPIFVTVPTGTHFIKVKATNINDGGCDLDLIDPVKLQMPSTPTPTPTPSPTNTNTPLPTAIPTATPTPTATPLPPSATPTATPLPATPTPTPTPLPPSATPSPTPSVTPTRYYLQLQMCGTATPPGTNTGWTMNSYLQSECQVGDIFDSGSGEMTGFYQVINYSISDQGGSIPGSKNTRGYTSCADTPAGQYTPPVYRTAHMTMNYYSGYTMVSQITGNTCGKFIYQVPTGSTTYGVYFDVSVTGTTPTPGIAYASLYSGSTDGTPVTSLPQIANQGHYWAVALGGGNQFTHIVYINNGAIGGWYDCATGNQINYP